MTRDRKGLREEAAERRLLQLRGGAPWNLATIQAMTQDEGWTQEGQLCSGAADNLTELAMAMGVSPSRLRATPEIRPWVQDWLGEELDWEKGKPGRKNFVGGRRGPMEFEALCQEWERVTTRQKKQVAREKARSARGSYKRTQPQRQCVRAPLWDELRDGQEVTEQQLAAFYRAQRARALEYRPGELREVHVTGRTGRRISHFFGDPAGAWGQFAGQHRRGTLYYTKF